MRLTWLGHSCVLLEGTHTVIFDPFTPSLPIPRSPDIIALTHGHGDHIGETVHLHTTTVAINETAKVLAKEGIDVEGMNIGGTIEVKGVTFTMTPAIHSGGLELGGSMKYGGGACGYVVAMDDLKVYHAGDTAIFTDMELIGELYSPDVALLPIGGRFTMGPREAMMAAQFIGAPLVIPIHYDTWPAIRQDPISFKNAIERTTDLHVAVLKAGESLDLDAATIRKRV
ncbi:MAG: metal-dependent hydrolase [Methanomicrobiales archaeon]|nr:metal-dependent hydrolase [Methanomicrobiales archaeon]